MPFFTLMENTGAKFIDQSWKMYNRLGFWDHGYAPA
jgi:hypothetical protein